MILNIKLKLNVAVAILLIVFFASCEKINLETASLSKLEQHIRSSQDSRATHSWAQYEELLQTISADKFVVLPMNEMRKHFDPTKVVVGLRHDVDTHPFKAFEMAELEQEYNIKSTYYILSTAEYHGQFKSGGFVRNQAIHQVYEDLFSLGMEIGIHNDLIAVMIQYGMDPFIFNHDELSYYSQLGIPIYGSAAHGSYIAQQVVRNMEIFSDYASADYVEYKGKQYPIGEYSMQEYGFEYEAYDVDYNKYFSESGGKWSAEGGLEETINLLRNSEPGDRIQILTHPVWWGK